MHKSTASRILPNFERTSRTNAANRHLRAITANSLLLFIGVTLEVTGFVLAWRDLNVEESAFDRFRRRPGTARPDVVRLGVRSHPVSLPTALSIEERVEAIEVRLNQLQTDLDSRLEKDSLELNERLDHVKSSLSQDFRDELAALASVVQFAHSDSITKRQGIVLFIVGLVLSGASQLN